MICRQNTCFYNYRRYMLICYTTGAIGKIPKSWTWQAWRAVRVSCHWAGILHGSLSAFQSPLFTTSIPHTTVFMLKSKNRGGRAQGRSQKTDISVTDCKFSSATWVLPHWGMLYSQQCCLFFTKSRYLEVFLVEVVLAEILNKWVEKQWMLQ